MSRVSSRKMLATNAQQRARKRPNSDRDLFRRAAEGRAIGTATVALDLSPHDLYPHSLIHLPFMASTLSRRIDRYVLLAHVVLLTAGIVVGLPDGAHAQEKTVVLNPYESVNWDAPHHKGNFHTHTTESDGSQAPAAVIDGYHAQDYNVLALTDHNHVTWPWQDYGRDPEQLGMTPVPGNELSRHNHNLSLFTTYPAPVRETSTNRIHTSIQEVAEQGGINVLAHPGRYWQPGDEPGRDPVPDDALAKYMGLFHGHEGLVGMEVHNQTDRYPWDRQLWDALLEAMMPERPVWGFANDDSHGEHHIGLNANWFPRAENGEAAIQAAIEDGQFYFSTVTTHPEKWQDLERTPRITNVNYDRQRNTLTISAEVEGEPVTPNQVRWISNGGNVVATGTSVDLGETEGLTTYLRAEIRSEGAQTYSQPFGLSVE